MAETVDDGKNQDSPVLAEDRVRQQGPEQGQEIGAGDESVIPALGILITHGVRLAVCVHEVLGHEDHQDRVHAIVTEPLGRFVADDVRYARRHFVGL